VAEVIDAVVVGSGPNGLAAAILLARSGRRVVVLEAAATPGGGARSAELTLPGFVHDVCSAVYPFAVQSPFFRTLPLADYGLEWIEPPAMVAHPFDDGDAAVVYRSLDQTARGFGAEADEYRRAFGPTVGDWDRLESAVLGPLSWPRHPVSLAAFGLRALRSADSFAHRFFRNARARALFAGLAAHGMLPLDFRLTAGVGLVLGAMAHVAGWLIPRGGSQQLSNALVAHLRALGGEVRLDSPVTSIDQLPSARAVLCDLSPKPLLRIAGHRFPPSYRRALERYRYGMGVFKVDWALGGAIPWRSRDCALAATVHLGGTFEEIERSERDAWIGHPSDRPFTLVVQPTLFDPSRAPRGRHTAWGYCHTPHGSTVDMLARIEAQIERFAPGFADRIVARHVMAPADVERYNPNFVGGDIAAGVNDLPQFFMRPTRSTYSTPVPGLYVCSAATPPGVGVHGMCGYFAAKRALAEVL
jgi:phytoene dehydrogenase-like protein